MSLITMPAMYGYQIAGESPRPHGVLYDYELGGNGLYLRARREGLSVCFRVEEFTVKGLPRIAESFEMAYPPVPSVLVTSMLQVAKKYGAEGLENLFHFIFDEGDWFLDNPEQYRAATKCRPLDDGPGSSYERAFIEAHSHHRFQCYFSEGPNGDDGAETGFRIYAVLGDIFQKPKIRVRVGVYGHFWTIPAEWVFELPEGLIDSYEYK